MVSKGKDMMVKPDGYPIQVFQFREAETTWLGRFLDQLVALRTPVSSMPEERRSIENLLPVRDQTGPLKVIVDSVNPGKGKRLVATGHADGYSLVQIVRTWTGRYRVVVYLHLKSSVMG